MQKFKQQAEQKKNLANQLYKDGKFQQALNLYSQAIQLLQSSSQIPKNTAILYSNRAICHLKLQNNGLALQDGIKAIKIDPNYLKGYYRVGTAYVTLTKFQQALNIFNKALQMDKENGDLKNKLLQVKQLFNCYKKEQKKKSFLEAISDERSQKKSKLLDQLDKIDDSNATGPRLNSKDDITIEWIKQLLQHLSNQKILHIKYLYIILKEVKEILSKQPNLVEINIENNQQITVCGDVHGQFYDLLNIFSINQYPSEDNPYLFNGDFVDRGSFSIEVIVTLFAFKVYNPKCMYLNRGNHQAISMNQLYGQFGMTRFKGEVIHKYNINTFQIFSEIFNCLPLASIINKKVFVCHGGLSDQSNLNLQKIKDLDRFREPPETGLMCDLLWADPSPEKGYSTSKRGVSKGFGPDITKKFLDQNKLVRSHQTKTNGYEEQHEGRLITIFSAPNYCDQIGNLGALIRFKGSEMKPKFTSFVHVKHPNIPVMAYTNRSILF